MAPLSFSHLCLCIFLLSLLLPFSSQTKPSKPKGRKPPPSFESIKHLEGSRKGQNAEGIQQLKKFLHHFGYLNYPRSPNNTHENDDKFDDLLESAVKTYQLSYRLNVTGTLDTNTLSTMVTPRCGVPDIINGTNLLLSANKTSQHHFHTVSHYSFFPDLQRWPALKTYLTYGFLPGTNLTATVAVAQAFDKWAAATQYFTFAQVQDYTSADLKISFQRLDHGDDQPFDGRGGILAHAFAPTDGRLHFDGDELWTIGAMPGYQDLGTVALHEIGHLLGLGHSSVQDSIMFAFISPGVTKGLHADDIQGIKALYNV